MLTSKVSSDTCLAKTSSVRSRDFTPMVQFAGLERNSDPAKKKSRLTSPRTSSNSSQSINYCISFFSLASPRVPSQLPTFGLFASTDLAQRGARDGFEDARERNHDRRRSIPFPKKGDLSNLRIEPQRLSFDEPKQLRKIAAEFAFS